MKQNIYIILASVLLLLGFSGCKDFDEINTDPNAASEDQIEVAWMLNNSITGAQMDPHIHERIFVLNWMGAGRYMSGGILNTGGYSDGWNSDYFNSYISAWMKNAAQTVQLADLKLENDNFTSEYQKNMTKHVREIARIWYVYLLSEFTDNFGPAPINGFTGETPTYSSVNEVYKFMLEELKEAEAAISADFAAKDDDKRYDKAYGFDGSKWKKYANSMRMRLAMRISSAEPQLAKQHFEEAAKKNFIAANDDIFQVAEADGWHALAGVFSRGWNALNVSQSFINVVVGLGGVPTEEILPKDSPAQTKIKPKGYLGMRFEKHYPTYTNDPYTGFFMDGLPYSIDPRFFNVYSIPGTSGHPFFSDRNEPFKDNPATISNKNGDETTVVKELDVRYTINSYCEGNWGELSGLNSIRGRYPWAVPALDKKYRNSQNKRVFYGPWESYFLIAEASIKGWSVPMSAKAAYEKGVRVSFEHNGVAQFADAYLASRDYNRVGTSVAWDHTAEPPASVEMDIINGYTGNPEKYEYKYPVASNTLYGKALNDPLTKIITQKYIAQCPYVVLEAWSDKRRTGLPFFETPAVEASLNSMLQLNKSNVLGKQKYNFFSQRLRYPSVFQNSNPEGYEQALELIGGENDVFAPLPWAFK